MTETNDLRAWLTLLRAPGVGPAAIRAWLQQGGDIHAALLLASRERRLDAAARAWLTSPDERLLDADMAWLEAPDHRLLRCDEADFPPQLETIADPPAALFVHGDAGLLLHAQVAIVGARGASASGLANARMFAQALAGTGLVVTSGLAEGIDGAAHAAALDGGGVTVAVMGTGPDRIYPRRHGKLAARIAQAGVLASEFVPGTGPRPHHFPRRNRILSALALGTLVVEAGMRSGSLITARLASEQGREVFAIPGSIHNPLARGCHRLIRDGARLVETVDEVLEAVRPLALAQGTELARRLQQHGAKVSDAVHARSADPREKRLLESMGWEEPLPPDTLSRRSGLSASEVSALLLELELDGQVASQTGGCWLRLPARA